MMRIIDQIIARRHELDFMTVARALTLKAGLEGPAKDRGRNFRDTARKLKISRQAQNNWLKHDMAEWLDIWDKRGADGHQSNDQEGRMARIVDGIFSRRHELDFMTVARALTLKAGIEGPVKDRGRNFRDTARKLKISRQTRNNWLKRDLAEWLEIWDKRLAAVESKTPPPKKKRARISESEWAWIARVLANAPGASWKQRQKSVVSAAARDVLYGHLRGISEVTLWRNRARIWAGGSAS